MGPARFRRGLSLLEVLVSMFVLLFGLLGVASLFPLGQYNVSRASRSDRAAAVGQAAFNEIKVRGLLRPYDPNVAQRWMPVTPALGPAMPALPTPMRAQFDPLATVAAHPTSLAVVTLPGLFRNSGAPSDSAAWHVFVSRDDLVTSLPAQRDLPAVQLYNQSRSYSGQYSWMFTVAPSDTSSEFLMVSVAVFYKRNPANEFTKGPGPSSGGFNGGGRISFSPLTLAEFESFKAGDWCLLSQPVLTTVTSPFSRPYYRWAQIDSARYDYSVSGCYLQFTGPQWDNVNAGNGPAYVTHYDGVVAVYEKLIRIESPTDWSW